MPTKPVFISYSRKDSDFVNEFIEKLRGAGVHLWIDKNIKLGGRWDNSIETALESCDDVLVIASENSMESNNVLDEVAYCLEENKRVIPIRIEDCEMNFRLRRIQHLDYFEDEEGAFERLLKALNKDPKEDVASLELNKEKKIPKTVPKPEAPVSVDSPKKNNRSLIYVAIVVVVAGIIYFGAGLNKSTDSNTNNFDDVNSSVLSEDENNNSGSEEVVRTDQEDWDNFPENATIETYRTHLANYTDCVHVETANNIIKDFEDISYQFETWKRAIATNETDVFLNYIEDFGRDGVYYSDAIAELEVLFDGRGYVQFSESNGNSFFEIFEASPGDIPKEKDLIYALSQRYIRAGKLGSQAYENILYTTQVDEAYIILEVEQVGTAFWVKVAF